MNFDVDIHPLGAGARADAAGPAIAAILDVMREAHLDEYGHLDFLDTPGGCAVSLTDSAYIARAHWLAVRRGVRVEDAAPADVLGHGGVELPLTDNVRQADVAVTVRPSARRRGIGTRLFDAAAEHLTAAGRTTWTGWAFAGPAVPGDHPRALVARSGYGVVASDHPATAFALRHGFTLEQTERQSVLLVLPGEAGRRREVAALRDGASTHAGADYETISWLGAVPESLRDEIARLNTTMSTDTPNADLDLEEEVWDADRIADMDARLDRSGTTCVTTAVRYRPTGRLAGYSMISWQRERPEGTWQWNTIVAGEHRGHRLGMLLKAHNLLALSDANPAAQRVHTWNAAENDHMLSINEALGFTSSGLEGAWQRRILARANGRPPSEPRLA